MPKEKQAIDHLFTITVGLDYDQPTSLESDLDQLGDLMVKQGLCDENFKPSARSGYLSEILAEIDDSNEKKLTEAIELCAGIDDILGRVEYCGLGEDDAAQLEQLVDDFVRQMEDYLNGLT